MALGQCKIQAQADTRRGLRIHAALGNRLQCLNRSGALASTAAQQERSRRAKRSRMMGYQGEAAWSADLSTESTPVRDCSAKNRRSCRVRLLAPRPVK